MRTTHLLLVSSILLPIALSGCAGTPLLGGSSGGGASGGCDPILFIREGVTTDSDVSTRCGWPTYRERVDSGTIWTYDPDAAQSAGDMVAARCGEMSGVAYSLCVASLPAKLYMTVEFDRNGVVTDYTARKEPRQAPPPATE